MKPAAPDQSMAIMVATDPARGRVLADLRCEIKKRCNDPQRGNQLRDSVDRF